MHSGCHWAGEPANRLMPASFVTINACCPTSHAALSPAKPSSPGWRSSARSLRALVLDRWVPLMIVFAAVLDARADMFQNLWRFSAAMSQPVPSTVAAVVKDAVVLDAERWRRNQGLYFSGPRPGKLTQ